MFDQCKLCSTPTFSSVRNIDKGQDQSLIRVQENRQADKDRFVRTTTNTRRKKSHEITENRDNIPQLTNISNSETSSMTYLPVHFYGYEKDCNENLVNDKFTEQRIAEPNVVLFERTSIEKNIVLPLRSSNHLPTTERPLLLMSNYVKRRQYLRYCIRDYYHDSKVFTPTASQADEQTATAKKPQCLPPLGPPPIMQPQPPKRPPLPMCPKKEEKKKKFAALDQRCLLMNRQTVRFVGYLTPED